VQAECAGRPLLACRLISAPCAAPPAGPKLVSSGPKLKSVPAPGRPSSGGAQKQGQKGGGGGSSSKKRAAEAAKHDDLQAISAIIAGAAGGDGAAPITDLLQAAKPKPAAKAAKRQR
jgi:hypothetical protein